MRWRVCARCGGGGGRETLGGRGGFDGGAGHVRNALFPRFARFREAASLRWPPRRLLSPFLSILLF